MLDGRNAVHSWPVQSGTLCAEFVSNFNASLFLFAAAALSMVAVPSQAQQNRRDEQDAAMSATRRGSVHSLRDIEGEIVPSMKRRGAHYIGAEFDSDVMRYRLKFVRGSSVIWIDVDGRTGNIIARAGN
jgi:hypothetical protein